MKNAQKIYAKLNLNLYVKGVDDGGYHLIESYVTSLNIYDEITVTTRTDDEITVTYNNINPNVPLNADKAYIAGKAFVEKFGTKGCDIEITKNIPLGGGLGGSSADISGVIKCLKELNGKKDEDVLPLLNELGSDTVFMYGGGFAKISGRGNVVETIESDAKMYFVLAYPDFSVDSKTAYESYDENPTTNRFAEYYYNALYNGVAEKFPALKRIKTALEQTKATGVSMTGSGSVMFAVYGSEQERNEAYDGLKADGVTFIKAESL